ncbi:uncharacterized protein LOC141631876 [Silene latifolia]|uniref:uncharacterized protein LOC141631876 n=1 Tax=Silene latifolia TaxID=37657 RepID=UPI003D785E6C
MKIDLRKAHDSIEWDFVEDMLYALKFPRRMIGWIMQCVSAHAYTLPLNGPSLVTLKDGEASGLHINKDNSDIYMNEVAAADEQAILSISGFKKGSLPFKYLRITISYKRIFNVECSILVDKLVARIRGWGAKHLSYAGRLLLVKTVLTQIHSYWARIFLLPKAIIHKVESICRAYLWSGTKEHHKAPAVAWDKCCLPKNQGELGILNCYNWNIATLGKYIWWVANKKDCLWVRWVHHLYIKQHDWWHYSPTTNSSWTWRQLCKVKALLEPGFVHHNWLQAPYSATAVYKWLSGDHLKVSWQPFVCNRLTLPRVNFINWLFIKSRLLTKDRLAKFGVIIDGVCYLCGTLQETLKWRGRSLLHKKLILAALASLVNFIWEGQNKCRVENWVPHPEHIRKRIQDVLSDRLTSLRMERVHSWDMNWVKEVGLL